METILLLAGAGLVAGFMYWKTNYGNYQMPMNTPLSQQISSYLQSLPQLIGTMLFWPVAFIACRFQPCGGL
jgi:hypothetical protein